MNALYCSFVENFGSFLALEEEREQEAAESRKAAVVEANRRSSLDESEVDGKTTRLSIRMDKCQVKYRLARK